MLNCERFPGDPRTDAELYAEALELATLAEDTGFDSVWTSEHHFWDDGYSPAVLPLCAAIAARTERVEVGTASLLAPLYDPLRLAEDAATVDLISQDRLVLGLALGWRKEEFDAFGVPTRERAKRLEDTVATLRQAWAGEPVTGGPTIGYPGVRPFPRPSASGPPIWIGGIAEPAVRRAARIGDGYLGVAIVNPDIQEKAAASSPAPVAKQMEWIREELDRSGRSLDDFSICLFVNCFAWADGDAWDLVREHYCYAYWKYEDMAEARGRPGPPPAMPPLTDELASKYRSQLLVGKPDEVADSLGALREAAGTDVHFMVRLLWPGMPIAMQREAVRLFASEVAPRVRADAGATA